ncbi:hypothetical protein GCM10023230_00970 [Flavobacterium hankyongi]|uniref:Uncharacterized protein n=1 Tax=Flavobacterium hankyongi TaxID=1176532 RepID=A0ABP8ZJ83_9FLAO
MQIGSYITREENNETLSQVGTFSKLLNTSAIIKAKAIRNKVSIVDDFVLSSSAAVGLDI